MAINSCLLFDEQTPEREIHLGLPSTVFDSSRLDAMVKDDRLTGCFATTDSHRDLMTASSRLSVLKHDAALNMYH